MRGPLILRQVLPAAALAGALAGPAPALETVAGAALVVDHETGAVLLSKNADVPLPPASMSKIMTVFMLYEALRDGRVTLDHRFRVSERAASMKGSSMFLRPGEEVAVRDLIPGIIVQSGNDACVVVAEALAGTEEAFARRSTERARELGLTATVLANSTGWPHPEHRMSAHDLVALARRIVTDFPDDPAVTGDYGDFAQESFAFDGRVPANVNNRNPILGRGIGGDELIVADGLKTGHTEEAGFGLVGSAVREGRRIVFMVSGLPTERARREESEKLVSWAFRDFRNERLFAKGTVLAEAEVWMGAERRVPLVAAADIVATLPVVGRDQTVLTLLHEGPVPAPVAQGQPIARLRIEAPGLAPVEVPLVAGRAVAEGGILARLETAAITLAGRLLSRF